MNYINKMTLRAIQGGVLALGAPLGWLLIQYFHVPDLMLEIENNYGLYSYLLFATEIVFIAFGFYVGSKEQMISDVAIRDGLTGIYNLRFYIERLNQEIAHAHRSNTPLSIVYFDLDHFKSVNDNYGHPAGDEVLRRVADEILSISRQQDIFARVGGEEFSLLLPDTSLNNAVTKAEQIRQLIEGLRIQTDKTTIINITISLGVVSLRKNENINDFYKRADKNLYLAKEQGRNRIVSE